MRKQTLRVVTTRRESISFQTHHSKLHCVVCGRLIETIGAEELAALRALVEQKCTCNSIHPEKE